MIFSKLGQTSLVIATASAAVGVTIPALHAQNDPHEQYRNRDGVCDIQTILVTTSPGDNGANRFNQEHNGRGYTTARGTYSVGERIAARALILNVGGGNCDPFTVKLAVPGTTDRSGNTTNLEEVNVQIPALAPGQNNNNHTAQIAWLAPPSNATRNGNTYNHNGVKVSYPNSPNNQPDGRLPNGRPANTQNQASQYRYIVGPSASDIASTEAAKKGQCDWKVQWEISKPGNHMQKMLVGGQGSSFTAPGTYPSGQYIRTQPILTNVGTGNCKPLSLTNKMGIKVDGSSGSRTRYDENSSVCVGRGPDRSIKPGGKCGGGIAVIPAHCPIGGGYTYAKLSWKPYQNRWRFERNNDPDGDATNRNHTMEIKFKTSKTKGDNCK